MNNIAENVQKRIKGYLDLLWDKEGADDKSLKKYLVQGTTSSVGIRVTSIGLAFLSSVFWARILGPEDYGIYNYVYAIISILVIPTRLGLPRLLVREVAAYKVNKQWNYVKGILRRSNQFISLSGLVLIVLCSAFLFLKPNFFEDPVLERTFWWSLPLLLIMPHLAIRAYALRGLKEVVLSLVSERLIKSLVLVIVGVLVLLIGSDWFTPTSFMILVLVSFLLAFIYSIISLHNKLPDEVHRTRPFYRTKEWVRAMWPFLLLGGLTVLNARMDIVLLGILDTNKGVGLYQVAVKMGNMVTLVLASVNVVLGPLFSGLWTKQNLVKMQIVLTKSTRAIFILTIPIGLVLIFGGEWILGLLFGEEYADAGMALAILSVGYLFNAVMGSVGELLNMTGFEKYTALALGISAVVNVLFNILLIPAYGIEGAAIANLISVVTWNSFLGWFVFTKLNIVPSLFYSLK